MLLDILDRDKRSSMSLESAGKSGSTRTLAPPSAHIARAHIIQDLYFGFVNESVIKRLFKERTAESASSRRAMRLARER